MKIAIIIPLYNEERNIQTVVTDWLTVLTQLDDGQVVCINDGSTDRSLELLRNLQQQWPELVVLDQKNAGHGMSVLAGYRYAIENKFDYIFQVDGDNQIRATEFLKLWKHKGNDKAVLGMREYRYDPWLRRMISKLLSLLAVILFRSKITDLNVPYRLVPYNILKGFLEYLGDWRPFAPNIFLSLYVQQFKYEIVVVEHRERQAGKNSLSLWKLLRAITRSVGELFYWKLLSLKDLQNPS